MSACFLSLPHVSDAYFAFKCSIPELYPYQEHILIDEGVLDLRDPVIFHCPIPHSLMPWNHLEMICNIPSVPSSGCSKVFGTCKPLLSHDNFSYCDNKCEQRGEAVVKELQQVKSCSLRLPHILTQRPFRQNSPLLLLIGSVTFQTPGGLSIHLSQNHCLPPSKPVAPFLRFSNINCLLMHLSQDWPHSGGNGQR